MVHIHFTEEALKHMTDLQSTYIRLIYDTDGCGCAVNGIPTFIVTNKIEKDDITVASDHFSVIVHPKDATFFDDEMTIDFVNHAFRLKSPNGILNPVIPTGQLREGE